MNWIDKFESKFRRFGISNLMMYITCTMLVVYIGQYFLGIPLIGLLQFDRRLILMGQVWRLITFAIIPDASRFFWLLISLMFYYSVGQQLEGRWGVARFNLFYLLGIIGAIIAGFITGYTTNTYLNLSLFLAYAILNPDAEFRLYFMLPIKAKYLAIANLVVYGISIFYAVRTGNWNFVAALLFSLLNLFLFFGSDLFNNIKRYFRNKKRRAEFENQMRKGPWD